MVSCPQKLDIAVSEGWLPQTVNVFLQCRKLHCTPSISECAAPRNERPGKLSRHRFFASLALGDTSRHGRRLWHCRQSVDVGIGTSNLRFAALFLFTVSDMFDKIKYHPTENSYRHGFSSPFQSRRSEYVTWEHASNKVDRGQTKPVPNVHDEKKRKVKSHEKRNKKNLEAKWRRRKRYGTWTQLSTLQSHQIQPVWLP